jgi:hypothetical protein
MAYDFVFWPANTVFFVIYPLLNVKKRDFVSHYVFSVHGNATFLRVAFGGLWGERIFFKKSWTLLNDNANV